MKRVELRDVLRFAERHNGETFYTLATDKSFTLYRKRTGITFDLRPRKPSYLPLNETNLGKYLAIYNGSALANRYKTSIYDPTWRERSYLPRIFAEIQNEHLFEQCNRTDEELGGAPATTRQALYLARIGQGRFRDDLIASQGSCFVTGVTDERLLRAAHIKPWSECTDTERLDKHNGLLLTPLYDHLFDKHLMSFNDDGTILLSRSIPKTIIETLAIGGIARRHSLTEKGLAYLRQHRAAFRSKERGRKVQP